MEDNYVRSAYVVKVIDGDTITVLIENGFDQLVRATLRLARINTPEKDMDGYDKATAFITGQTLGRTLKIQTDKLKRKEGQVKDDWRRYIAEVWLPDGTNLNDMMLEKELARPWEVK